MKTFKEFWTEYVGETKHSPPIEEGDFSWIDDVAYNYAKYIQEQQIKISIEEVINYIYVHDDSGLYFDENKFIRNCKRVIK